jgi:hypothetical protein
LSRTLVVDPGPFIWKLGLVDEAGLAALHVVDLVDGVEGDLFRARVTAAAPALGGVFAEIGRAASVFVRLPTAWRRPPPDVGATLLVQGVADAVADKGARATPRIVLEGAYLSLRADDGGSAGRAEVPASAAAGSRARALFAGRPVELGPRAAAVDDATLVAEADLLATLLATARRRFAASDAVPGPLLTREERLALALRRVAADAATVVTSAAILLRVARLAASAGLNAPVTGAGEPWTAAGAADALAEAAAPELAIEGGAALVIEPTAACVAVDVDRRGATAAAATLNAAAVTTLARAIAVRELGGQLVVDFLDPGGGPARAALADLLHTRLQPLEVRVVTVLRSGLAVLERPRRTAALHERRAPPRDAAERLLRLAAGHAILRAAVAADVDAQLARADLAEAARAWLDVHGSRLVPRRAPELPPATFELESAVS